MNFLNTIFQCTWKMIRLRSDFIPKERFPRTHPKKTFLIEKPFPRILLFESYLSLMYISEEGSYEYMNKYIIWNGPCRNKFSDVGLILEYLCRDFSLSGETFNTQVSFETSNYSYKTSKLN